MCCTPLPLVVVICNEAKKTTEIWLGCDLQNKKTKKTKGGIPPPFIVVIVDFNEAKKLKNTQGVVIYERKKKKTHVNSILCKFSLFNMKITRRGIFVDVIVVYDEVKHLKGRKLENMKTKKHKEWD